MWFRGIGFWLSKHMFCVSVCVHVCVSFSHDWLHIPWHWTVSRHFQPEFFSARSIESTANSKLGQDQIKQLRDVFMMIDGNGDGARRHVRLVCWGLPLFERTMQKPPLTQTTLGPACVCPSVCVCACSCIPKVTIWCLSKTPNREYKLA